jgi:hypothetical protein
MFKSFKKGSESMIFILLHKNKKYVMLVPIQQDLCHVIEQNIQELLPS